VDTRVGKFARCRRQLYDEVFIARFRQALGLFVLAEQNQPNT
jgi:hypothetical protein